MGQSLEQNASIGDTIKMRMMTTMMPILTMISMMMIVVMVVIMVVVMLMMKMMTQVLVCVCFRPLNCQYNIVCRNRYTVDLPMHCEKRYIADPQIDEVRRSN